MLIARLDEAGLSYGTHQVFAGVSLSLNDGEKIGLVGPNGAGKSSLLKLLAGIEPPSGGARTLRRGATVAYLAQEYAGEGAPTALDEVIRGRPDLLALEGVLEGVERELADPALAEDLDRFGQVLARQAALLEEYEEGGRAAPAQRGARLPGAAGAAGGVARPPGARTERRAAEDGRAGPLPGRAIASY